MSEIATITAQQLMNRKEAPLELIDVRTPVEFQAVHAVEARNVPLDALDPHQIMEQRQGSPEQTLFIICQSGKRGEKACQKFVDAGYPQVVNVMGGTEAWAAAGLPVVRGKQAISLERQVRIVAGFLVLLGSILGLVFSPYFLALPAFVGAGLMFAGITDTCGMAMLLAKMPWNQVRETADHCAAKPT